MRAFVVAALAASCVLLTVPAANAAHPISSALCTKRLVSAHEGFTKYADGDTVESQQAAFDLGDNVADSDLWVTKDGYIVQMHDNDVSHSTDGQGLITEMTLDEVLQLHTKRFHNPIPQLNDSLAIPLAHEPGRYLMFETKGSFNREEYLRLLDDEINAAGMVGNVIIYSNYLQQVKALQQMDPALIVWYKSVSGVPDLDLVRDLDGVMLPSGVIKRSVVKEFHSAGLVAIRERVQKDTEDTWNRFMKTDADGLMTADPRFAVKKCSEIP